MGAGSLSLSGEDGIHRRRWRVRRRLLHSSYRLLHSAAYFLAGCVGFVIFIAMLMIAESLIYAVSGVSLSPWSVVVAALVTAFYFSPIVRFLHDRIDQRLFPERLDSLAAIRQLGAGDLAQLPPENVERSLLERIATVCSRSPVALDESTADGGRRCFCQPKEAPPPAADGVVQPPYVAAVAIPTAHGGTSWLHFGPRTDFLPLDEAERNGLESLARFAATSLEHARLSQQQAQAARLDSIARVAAQLQSHDLKNRIHDLEFLAHHLESGALDPEEIQALVVAVRKVSGRMQTLMQRMTDPNAPLTLKRKPVDLRRQLQREVEARLWPEGVRIFCDLQPVPLIHADPDLLFSVFENLFDNAVQAVNKQGRIWLTLRADGDMVEATVRDDGIGMSAHYLRHRLFELFSTSKEHGLGIGLYLSRRIVRLHGGTITADSAGEGAGACFTVRLPIWRQAAERKEGDDAP
ncbi:MAG: ATP-binding protein [Zetaproteobacteria bacterium]|nr:MAG: ATP-binding protein [Zetaproteobacteria bacterium]